MPIAPAKSEVEALRERLDPSRMPRHIAIITDGNGRWAKKRGMPRVEGHRRGYQTARKIVRAASDLGLTALTMYAFSAENWSRPKLEVDALMHLFETAARRELNELRENNVRIQYLGRREGLPASLQHEMDRDMEATQGNTGLILNLAINYGGRAEITDAVRKIASKVLAGAMLPEEITEHSVGEHLYAPGLPDPDLMIRTAGEMRVSNFLLWEVAYTELWVTPDLWPDFTIRHLGEAIADYQRRVRKFGGVVDET
jgi:undecaprenyl diphosphate synthase